MPKKEERATLRDVLNYDPETYLSDEDLRLIRSTFKNNHTLLRLLRKVLIPTIADPALPVEQMGDDAYLAGRNWSQIPADEAKILMCARQDALQFITGGLIKLKIIANSNDESPKERQDRMGKDSAK